MKQLLFILIALINVAIAQQPLAITTDKTTSLIFPFPIKYVDRGTKDILVQPIKENENILLVKAANNSTTVQHLRLFNSDLIRRATDTTTIDLDALVAGAPISIFFCVPPAKIATYAPIVRLWLSGLMQLLAQRTSPPHRRTLILADEIAALGPMDAFVSATTLMREWGVILWSFWQSLAQLGSYGCHSRTILDNASVIQLFGVRNYRSAQDFVELVGGIHAEDIIFMAKDEQLLLVEGGAPYVAKQVRYYNDFAVPPGSYDTSPLVPNTAIVGPCKR